jgi:riboflavin transporter FmnP
VLYRKKTFYRKIATTRIAKIAVLSALSYILYLFVKFPLPFLFPSFLEIQISDLPALIGGFMLGPIDGCVIILVKCLLKLPLTKTSGVGELGDVLIGIAFVLTSSLIYRRRGKNKQNAIFGLALGIAASTLVAMLVNYTLLVPFYVKVTFNGSYAVLINMLQVFFPDVTEKNFDLYYIFLTVLPFNVLRGAIVAALSFLVYKRTHVLFNKF